MPRNSIVIGALIEKDNVMFCHSPGLISDPLTSFSAKILEPTLAAISNLITVPFTELLTFNLNFTEYTPGGIRE